MELGAWRKKYLNFNIFNYDGRFKKFTKEFNRNILPLSHFYSAGKYIWGEC